MVGYWSCVLALLLFATPRLFAQPAPPVSPPVNCTTADLIAELERTNHIFLNCSNTVTLTNPIVISGDVTIEGVTNRAVTLSGNNATRIFTVLPGGSLTLLNLTLTAGKAGRGAAINNQGIIFATNCTFKANKAVGANGTNGVAGEDGYPNAGDGGNGIPGASGLGGAIFSEGELYLSRCTFGENGATGGNGGPGGAGGNVLNNGYNSGDGGDGGAGAPGRGGAIYNLGRVELSECVFDKNTATGGNGGAFGAAGTAGLPGEPGRGGLGAFASGAAIHNTAYILIEKSTFSENRVEAGDSGPTAGEDLGDGSNGLPGGSAWGGAICNLRDADVINSTFSTNRVVGGDGGKGADASLEGGHGGDGGAGHGGNFFSNGSAVLVNCTFAGGSARGGTNGVGGAGPTPGNPGRVGAAAGGNLARVGGGLAIKNCIVARPGTGANGYGAIFDAGYNLSSDGSIAMSHPESYMNTGAGMGGLAANGGFGRTFALASQSFAVDGGDPGDSPETDQRNIPIFGDRRDIGAYEFAASSIAVHVADSSGVPVPGVRVVVGTQTNVTDGAGNTTFPPLPAGEYTVVPAHATYTFEPPSETVELGPAVSLTFTAVRTFSIAGYVTDGVAPVKDVTVTIGDEETTTDTNGFYRVSGLDAGAHTVEPSAAGYGFVPSLQQIDLQADRTNVNFTAVGLLSISGRIRTEAGQGLAGVTVRAGSRTGITSPTGDYTIEQVPAREQVVTPSLSGYSFIPASLTVTPTGQENGIDFSAYSSFQVSGFVRHTSNGLGASAVTLTLRTNAPATTPPTAGASVSLVTDTNGFFSFTNVRAGSYVLTPSRSGHGFSPATNLINITANSVTDLAYLMYPAFSMSGRVTAAGVGVSNAAVILRTNGTEVARTTSDEFGLYAFNNYPRATYVLVPELAGYQFTPTNRTVVSLSGNSNNLDFASSGVFAIRGRVTKDGTPLPNVTVRTTGSVSITDSSGNYALTNLPPGTYTVVADDVRYSMQPASAAVTVGPDQSGINFQAVEVYTVNGEVMEGALPLAGVRIIANGVTNFTLANGRYSLPRVPAGSNVIVSASLAGYDFNPPQHSIVVDSIENNVNFSARGLSAVSGRVIDAVTSNGVGSVTITVAGRYKTNTSPTGFYTVTNVGPGFHTVEPARTNRGFTPVSQQVNVLTNSVTNNVNFVSFRSSKLFGRVVFEDTTNGIAGVNVRAQGFIGTNVTVTDATTDADGNYVFPALRNAFYIVTPSRAGRGFEPQFHEVDLLQDTRLDFVTFEGFNISGRIIDGNTQAGVAGIQVNVNTPGITSTNTDANGFYSFTGLREGDYTVTPIAFGYDVTPTGRQLGVGPTNALNVNFVVRGNLTITGRVLDGVAGLSNVAVRLSTTNAPIVNRTLNTSASGTFTFTNLAPNTYIVAPIQSDLFLPTNFVVNPLNHPPLDFIAKGGQLSIVRSNTLLHITLRALPSRIYQLQTNSTSTNTWGTVTSRNTDTNGVATFLHPIGPPSSRTLFRTRR